jgi:hypothetical protein
VFTQGHQGTTQGQEDFELSWYLFFQQSTLCSSTIGSGLRKELICIRSKRNKCFPFLVVHADTHSVNSLVSAQKC